MWKAMLPDMNAYTFLHLEPVISNKGWIENHTIFTQALLCTVYSNVDSKGLLL